MSGKKTAGKLRQDYVDALGVKNFKCVQDDDKCINCNECVYNELTPIEIEVKRLQEERDGERRVSNAMLNRAMEAEGKIEQLKELLDPFVTLARAHCTGPYTPLDDWSVKVEIQAGALKRLIE